MALAVMTTAKPLALISPAATIEAIGVSGVDISGVRLPACNSRLLALENGLMALGVVAGLSAATRLAPDCMMMSSPVCTVSPLSETVLLPVVKMAFPPALMLMRPVDVKSPVIVASKLGS